MNSTIFLDSDGEVITYEGLISEINQQSYFIPKLKENSLKDFFINLIVGLISNQEITLLDSDITDSELETLNVNEINYAKKINKPHIENHAHLIKLIENTNSNIILFTSGTTGQPKQVHHSYKTLARGVKVGERFKDNIWGFAYNPTHMAGLQVFLQAFCNMNPLINLFNKSREYVIEKILDSKVSHISATPTFYRLLLPVEECKEVKQVTLGGEKSTLALHNSIKKMFPNAKVTNLYASTEAGTLFASKGEAFVVPQSIKDKIKIINGELYLHKSLLGTSKSFQYINDFYPTGDLIEWINQENLEFVFKSRKNELINVGGYKINPTEVEECIRAISGVKDAFVYGKPNSILGYILCSDVVLYKNSDLTELHIRKVLKESLQDFKIPRRIKFVNSISTTRTGKLSRK